MENEAPTVSVQEDGRGSMRGRIMGKLFKARDRERKVSNDGGANLDNGLNDFLRGPSDTLTVAHAGPPMLAKLDVKAVTRYPNAGNVHGHEGFQQDLAYRPRSNRVKKGLFVRFVDAHPEIIGDGGDECEIPTVEIAKRKNSRPPAVTAATAPARPTDIQAPARMPTLDAQTGGDAFMPSPLRRTQTGYSSVGSLEPEIPAGRSVPARHLDNRVVSQDDKRRSFIEMHQAEMRQAEGLAFANAVRSGTPSSQPTITSSPPSPEMGRHGRFTESPTSTEPPEMDDQFEQAVQPPPVPPRFSPNPPQQLPMPRSSPIHPVPPSASKEPARSPQQPPLALQVPHGIKKSSNLEQSPSSVYSTSSSLQQPYLMIRQTSKVSDRGNISPASSHHPSLNMADGGDAAMKTFVDRTRHLFELFRLHGESVRPLRSWTPEEIMRAAFWWFINGRSALEIAIRERPTTPQSQQRNNIAKQQAHADLAKAYWLSEEILPETISTRSGPAGPRIDEACQILGSNLRKLASSMERNGFLPPEEALLPQAIDRSIWLEYPQLSHDIVSLLCGSPISALGPTQQQAAGMDIPDALPLADTPQFFCFGRFHADVFLMEQGREQQRLYFSCFLSIVRSQKQPDLSFVIASQNGCVQLRISSNKSAGPVWEDIRWRSDSCMLDIRLPRGFILAVQCSQQNFNMLWNMYDFSAKVHASLYPKKDEMCVFRTTLRSFQYFDNDPQARQFPKDPIAGCDVALFERIHREGAATGPRNYHRGFRVGVVTGPRTKTLSGVNQTYDPQTPVQFGFLRSEANDPALSLKFDNGRTKGNMVMSFADDQDRLRIHSLLIGTALQRDEHVFCEVPLNGVWFSERYGDGKHLGLAAMSRLPWQRARIINHDNDGDRPSCVLSDRLRVVYEFQDGTLTDRINVAPGELKIRLDVHNPSCIMIYRLAQSDMTVAVTEAKVSKELPPNLALGLDMLRQAPTIRTFMFPSMNEMHAFQTAITGFKVLFDGVASAFAISRRRMVVPIHKKWEAGSTRIQVVQQDGVMQLLAFFDNFSHGLSMGFTLKGTDVFESFSRGGKAGLKIDDAKFPLPKVLPPQDSDSAQAAAEAAFVCLDLPELPGEHDDITILFDTEAVREALVACLPAPVKGSRLSKIKGIGGG
ncbi:hypothetical protein V8F20_003043 [Naviculisporaceae sp. PSN 640]